ncbi:MAG: HAD family hydrolase, partial [Armatimonadota bacterium]
MSTPDIRLITTDLDGTLVQNASDVSEANINALKAAVAKGIEVCIATGRSHHSASQFARRLGIDKSIIIS